MTDPLVLLPGFMADARLWGAQIEALSTDVALCLPVYGEAARVEDMATAALSACPPRFAVAGHGLGAAVAMEMLRIAPDRVARIALLSSGCLAEPAAAAADRETRLARARAGALDRALADDFPDSAFAPTEMAKAVQDFVIGMARDLGAEVYLRQSRAMQRRPDQQRTLRQARLPALVVAGRHDRVVLPRRQQFMAELLPRGEYREVEAGHYTTIEAPDSVTAALRDWLARAAEPMLLR